MIRDLLLPHMSCLFLFLIRPRGISDLARISPQVKMRATSVQSFEIAFPPRAWLRFFALTGADVNVLLRHGWRLYGLRANAGPES